MMFLDLPVDVQHEVYNRLDIKHRTRLNIALPKPHKISRTTRTNPTKDAKLKYLSQLMKVKRYKSANDVPESCMRFITENPDDPTVKEICASLKYTPSRQSALLQDIRNNTVSISTPYLLSPSHAYGDVLTEIARHATPTTFDNILLNPSTSSILTRCFLELNDAISYPNHVGNFFFTLVNYHNTSLLSHVLLSASLLQPLQRHAQQWRQKAIAYLESLAHIFCSLKSIKILCEIVRVSDKSKEKMLTTAIENMDITTADYLTSQGAKLAT